MLKHVLRYMCKLLKLLCFASKLLCCLVAGWPAIFYCFWFTTRCGGYKQLLLMKRNLITLTHCLASVFNTFEEVDLFSKIRSTVYLWLSCSETLTVHLTSLANNCFFFIGKEHEHNSQFNSPSSAMIVSKHFQNQKRCKEIDIKSKVCYCISKHKTEFITFEWCSIMEF